jgi:alpha-D-xyloside xylohydrolase
MKTLFRLLTSTIIVCATSAGYAQNVSVEFYTPSIARVVKAAEPGLSGNRQGSFAVTLQPQKVPVKISQKGSATVYSTSALKVSVDDKTGAVKFETARGKSLLREGTFGFTRRTEGLDQDAYSLRQSFILEPWEPVYGLGSLQGGQLSLRGQSFHMMQSNLEDYCPVVQSVKGYGIFWDNPSPGDFKDSADGMSFESQVGECIDYYFIYGGNADGVVAGVRELTGEVPMMPLWSYGFMQSRERYKSTAEVLDVLHRYRQAGIPIDCMIQDWQYWGDNYLWNAMEFNSENYTDAQKMIDEIHDNNAHLMISIWSSFGPQTKQYAELKARGHLLDFITWPMSGLSFWPPRRDYPSGVRAYDPFSSEARDIYWKYLRHLEDMGVDAWWMDSTEPDYNDFHDSELDQMTAAGSWRRVRNAYPLETVGGVYEHQRAYTSDHRVCILTRSAYTGQQRMGANLWSGDVTSSWDNLRKQVPAGLGFAMTGNPNFNCDLGGFFANAYNSGRRSGVDNQRYRELYVRWMQYGVFSPMMRSHGTEVPREIYLYGKPGEAVYDALVKAVRLRYSLLPYTYSTAWQVSSENGTFQRALVMDFPGDKNVWNISDEFMYGRSILVAPVLNAQYTSEKPGYDDSEIDFSKSYSRKVYLPAGASWYEGATNKLYKGGVSIDQKTSFDSVPVFFRAGSIVPVGPDVQYTSEKPWDNLEIRVYGGADGNFLLYEDEGDNYNYEKGAYSTICFRLIGRTLKISDRNGSFTGMLASRKFNIVFIEDGRQTARSVEYDGKELSVKF